MEYNILLEMINPQQCDSSYNVVLYSPFSLSYTTGAEYQNSIISVSGDKSITYMYTDCYIITSDVLCIADQT